MLTLPLAAQAQAAARTPRPDPLNPTATVPALTYVSSLKLEQRPTTDAPVSWREANDTVARIGGWRVYAREASQPAPESKPTPHVHGGHQKP